LMKKLRRVEGVLTVERRDKLDDQDSGSND